MNNVIYMAEKKATRDQMISLITLLPVSLPCHKCRESFSHHLGKYAMNDDPYKIMQDYRKENNIIVDEPTLQSRYDLVIALCTLEYCGSYKLIRLLLEIFMRKGADEISINTDKYVTSSALSYLILKEHLGEHNEKDVRDKVIQALKSFIDSMIL